MVFMKIVMHQMIRECRIVGVFLLLSAVGHGFADDKTTAEHSAAPASVHQELSLLPLSQLGSNWLARVPFELHTGADGRQWGSTKEAKAIRQNPWLADMRGQQKVDENPICPSPAASVQ
jgi:hypothetical protein